MFNWDSIGFVLLSIGVIAVLHHFVLKGPSLNEAPRLTRRTFLVVLAGMIPLGVWMADRAGNREAALIKGMVEGLPPTYASELTELGHALIKEDTKKNDPAYLRMIEAQKRWLRINHSLNDIYTSRKTKNDNVVLVVDSETDYDRNGVYNGDREKRTSLYEPYDNVDPALQRTFATGQPQFTDKPYTDRWGTWMSAYAPMWDENGKLDGVLGIDFDASTWTANIQQARLVSLGNTTAIILLVAAFAALLTLMSEHVDHRAAVRRAESELQEKTRFEALVNAIQGVVWERDLSTLRFTFVSQQATALFGVSPERWTGHPDLWRSAVHPEDIERVIQVLTDAVKNGEDYRMDYRLCFGSAHIQWVDESGTYVHPVGDQPAALRGVLRDVSVRVRAMQDLEKAQKVIVETSHKAGMAEVAAGVLHNVGNVLNSINVSANLIQETISHSRAKKVGKVADILSAQKDKIGYYITEDAAGKKIPEYLRMLSQHLDQENATLRSEVTGLTRNVEHIKNIITKQQGYARIADRSEPLVLEHLMNDALEMSGAPFHHHGITLEKYCDATPRVMADRHKVLQILINLIRNAKHAVKQNKEGNRKIRIDIFECQPGMVRLTVTDNGIGIPTENLKRIFNHGFTTKENGHGFGLHASGVAAQQMGGGLNADSDGPGEGATFILDLPSLLDHSPHPTDETALPA